jgi:hypothetical protein
MMGKTRERAVRACDVVWGHVGVDRRGSDARRRRLLSGPRQEAAPWIGAPDGFGLMK